jgi:alkanesulfonate monooxygenase SsuD/methylene tetrahydromethanopterin reductase-like flavin-dependent oxidoreductase (luciferase family)
MRMIPKIWRDGVFEHQGQHISVPPREIHPKPFQQPHPPLFLAVTRDDTLNLAGEGGLGGLVLGFGGPEDVARKNAVYRAACRRRTAQTQIGDFAIEHLAALCPTIVLADGARARRIGARGQRFFTESINHWYANGPKPASDDLDLPDLERAMGQDRAALEELLRQHNVPITVASTMMFNLNHAYGTVEDARAYVSKLIDAGADEILLLMQMGTVPHEAIMETIRNYGRHIIPYFKARHSTNATLRPTG